MTTFTGIVYYKDGKEVKKMSDKEIEEIKRLYKTDEEGWKEQMYELQQKNDRLNNIINELEKWLNEKKIVWNITREDRDIDYTIVEVLDKLQELKGSDKE